VVNVEQPDNPLTLKTGSFTDIIKVANDLRLEDEKDAQDLKDFLDNLVKEHHNMNDQTLLAAIKESSKDTQKVEPVIASSSSSNSSKDHYLPEIHKGKGKNIDLTNLSPSEIDRRGLSPNVVEAPIVQPSITPEVTTQEVPEVKTGMTSL